MLVDQPPLRPATPYAPLSYYVLVVELHDHNAAKHFEQATIPIFGGVMMRGEKSQAPVGERSFWQSSAFPSNLLRRWIVQAGRRKRPGKVKEPPLFVIRAAMCIAALVWPAAAERVDTEAVAERAVQAERNGDFAGAATAFRMLLANGVDSPELRANLGIAYFQLHDYRRALQELQIALTKNPGSEPANLFGGLSLLSLERPKTAVPYLERAHRLQPGDIAPVLALARAELAANDLVRARDLYSEASHLDSQDAEAWYGLGITERILAERTLRSARAADESRVLMSASAHDLGEAMQLDPGSVHAHMVLGESFRIAERYDLAVAEYKAATARGPEFAPAWAGLAVAYSAAGNDAEALDAGKRALELDPKDASTNALLAGACLRMSDNTQAERYARKAVELQPELSEAHVALAKIYLARRQPQKALAELQPAVRDDNDGSVNYLLATTLRQLGREAEAQAAMRKYKQLHSARINPSPSLQ